MFHFPAFPSYTYWFSARSHDLLVRGSPIRKSTGRSLFTAHRGLSQLVTSFFGSWCQGIHLMLFSLVLLFELLWDNCSYNEKAFSLFSPYTFVFGSIVVYPRSRKDLHLWKIFLISNYLFVSFFIRFSMTILHHLMLYRLAFQRFYHFISALADTSCRR